jgi:hypothetical protein
MVVGGAFVKFDRPTPADDARIYPCADCGLMRSRSEGGTTFTVCDVCWDKAYPTAPAPDAGAAERAVGEARDAVVRFAVEARNHGTFPVNECGVIDQTSAAYQSYIATLADLWRSVDVYSAALRGTNQAKRGNDARKGGEGA